MFLYVVIDIRTKQVVRAVKIAAECETPAATARLSLNPAADERIFLMLGNEPAWESVQ